MKSVIGGIVLPSVMLLASASSRAEDPKEEIARLSNAYDAAIVARDGKALDKLFDDDGRFINPRGQVLDKRGYLAPFVDPKTAYESAKAEGKSIRVLGDVAIETVTFIGTRKEDGKPFLERIRCTAVWIRKGGTWVITSEQSTPIPDEK